MHVIPVTHNYDPEGVFLGNVCDLEPGEAECVLNRIRRSGRRQIKPTYLRRRFEAEAWLIAERRRLLGGTPGKGRSISSLGILRMARIHRGLAPSSCRFARCRRMS